MGEGYDYRVSQWKSRDWKLENLRESLNIIYFFYYIYIECLQSFVFFVR